MSFANAWMLVGLAAVAVPIILHLLNRRRAKDVDWGAMLSALCGKEDSIGQTSALQRSIRLILIPKRSISISNNKSFFRFLLLF